jgi:TrmH family RNA methyltransferase
VITSSANPKIRRLVRLRDHRRRRQSGRVLVDGWREVAMAAKAGLTLCSLYLPASDRSGGQGGATRDRPELASSLTELIARASEEDRQLVIADDLFEKISYGRSPRGVVAEFVQPDRSLGRLRLPADPLVLVLDRVEKPGNLGAVFRCADAAGVDAVIASGPAPDLFNPNVIRNSLGTVFTVPSAAANESDTASFLGSAGLRLLAARGDSSTSLWSCDLLGPLAVIFGSEAEGLGERWRHVDGREILGVRVPMFGQADSLNVSVSAAVVAYEAARVRSTAGTR